MRLSLIEPPHLVEDYSNGACSGEEGSHKGGGLSPDEGL